MSLPQPDPSNPALPAPLFADVDAVRGDHLRANNQLIWENLQYLFDFTGRTTDALTEGATNLYYTDARAKAAAIAAALTGFAAGSDAAIAATDTILQAFAKTQGQITADKAAIAAILTRASWRANTQIGLGSTATKIPYFSNVNENVDTLSAFTIVNDSTDGCKATINIAGVYSIVHWNGGNYSDYVGISVNGSPSTNITALAQGLALCMIYGSGGGSTDTLTASYTGYFAVNDVIRPHTNGGSGAANNRAGFSIVKVG